MEPNLADAVRANVYRLRTDRGWSQRELSVLMRAQGIRPWTPNTVALVETGKQRADRLADIAGLCAVFGVGVGELITGPDTVLLEGNTEPTPTATIALALDGTLPPPEIAALTDTDTQDRTSAETNAARTLGLDPGQFQWAVLDVFDRWSFYLLREERARVTDTMPASTVRARRGHATRALVLELQRVLERDGIEAMTARAAGRMRDRERAAAERDQPNNQPDNTQEQTP